MQIEFLKEIRHKNFREAIDLFNYPPNRIVSELTQLD